MPAYTAKQRRREERPGWRCVPLRRRGALAPRLRRDDPASSERRRPMKGAGPSTERTYQALPQRKSVSRRRESSTSSSRSTCCRPRSSGTRTSAAEVHEILERWDDVAPVRVKPSPCARPSCRRSTTESRGRWIAKQLRTASISVRTSHGQRGPMDERASPRAGTTSRRSSRKASARQARAGDDEDGLALTFATP